jgi:hypothetical protein
MSDNHFFFGAAAFAILSTPPLFIASISSGLNGVRLRVLFM